MIDAIAAGMARADAEVELGIANLEAALSTANEWDTTTHLGNYRASTVPTRASLRGMLGHLRDAYARNHQ